MAPSTRSRGGRAPPLSQLRTISSPVNSERLSAMGNPSQCVSGGLEGCTTPGSESTRTTADRTIAPSATPDYGNATGSGHSHEATVMLDSIVLPPGSRQVPRLTQAGLRREAQRPACTPLVDESRYWTVRSTVGQVESFLNTHPEQGRTTSTVGHSPARNTGEILLPKIPLINLQ